MRLIIESIFILALVIILSSCDSHKQTRHDDSIDKSNDQNTYNLSDLNEKELCFTSKATKSNILEPPFEKPIIHWTKNINLDSPNILVNEAGAIWYVTEATRTLSLSEITGEKHIPKHYKFPSRQSDELICLDARGSLLWKRDIPDLHNIRLICCCENAFVIVDNHGGIGLAPTIAFECINLNGDTIWRTNELESLVALDPQPCQINVGSVIGFGLNDLDENKNNLGYNLYSLENGSFIKRIKFSNTYIENGSIEKTHSLIGLEDETWITYINGVLTKYDIEFELVWSKDIHLMRFGVIQVKNNILLLSTVKYGIMALNVDTGVEKWTRGDIIGTNIVGSTPNGEVALYGLLKPDESWLENVQNTYQTSTDEEKKELELKFHSAINKFIVIDSEGEIISSHPTKGEFAFMSYKNIITYDDGSILFGQGNCISLSDPNGKIKWSIENKEFGNEEELEFAEWWFYATYDRRIIVVIDQLASQESKVFSLS